MDTYAWRMNMGTRCITRIFDGNTELACLYRQHDGYPEGHGKDIAAFLDGKRIVNGFGGAPGEINGAGHLATAFVVALHAKGVRLYLEPVGVKDHGQTYEYHVLVPSADDINAAQAETDKLPYSRDRPRGIPPTAKAFRFFDDMREVPLDKAEPAEDDAVAE